MNSNESKMAMNALLRRQTEIKAIVDELESKFGKVGDAARKETYFEKRLVELKEWWKEFEVNHVAIEELKSTAAEFVAYVADATYEKTLQKMHAAKKMYEEAYNAKFPGNPLPDIFGEQEEQFEKNVNNHNTTIIVQDNKKLEQIAKKTFVLRSTTVTDMGSKILARIGDLDSTIELGHELRKMENATDSYIKAFEEVAVMAEDAFEMEGLKLEHEDIIQMADRVIIALKTKLAKKNTEPEAPKLQALKVPKFKGECGQWVPFLNLFTKVVKENVKLTRVQKLQYLLDSLENEPKKLVQHLDVCDENFEAAMEILMRRYNDQRRIVNNHIDAILELSAAPDEAKGLKAIYDTCKESLYALKGQGIGEEQLGNAVLVRMIEKKLDARTRQQFEESLGEKRKVPKLEALLAFVEERFISMESVAHDQPNRRENITYSNKGGSKKDCVLCSGQHGIHHCTKFNKMTPSERNEAVRKANLCRNCLKNHSGRCNVSANCNKCKGFHHVALHFEKKREGNGNEQRSEAQAHIIDTERDEFDVMLATAIIRAKNRDGEYIELRALIDQGSTVSFISETAVQRMKLGRMKNSTVVTGIGAGKTEAIHGSTSVCIKPRYPSTFETPVDALILSKLTTYENTISQKWKHIDNLMLADPEYWKSGPIDMILGADIFAMIVLDGVLRGPVNTPVAQETMFGWILSGRVKRTAPPRKMVSLISDGALECRLEKFWKVEELQGDDINNLTKEEKLCEEFYSETSRRDKDGKYITRLPFKTGDIGLGKSRHIAVATLIQMEKRFKRDPQLKKEYAKCINEYLELDHMELAESSDEALTTIRGGEKCYECYYLPHHAVIKATSTTTKLRVVFNASQKSSNGVSLNELMMIGPTIQDDLMNILVRWRGHRIALAADIEKMYRQIHVEKRDYNYQRIVWRNDESEPIRDYCIKRVTFGNASAPFVAIRTIKQLALDEHDRFPKASAAAQSDFYVDDLITGAHTVEGAKELQSELRNMMESGGMNLRKWASNHTDALREIPEEHRELKTDISIDANTTLKMLGVQWDPKRDLFLYKIKLCPEKEQYTKRELVSEVARIFDPLGWLSPVVIMAKMRLQATWLLGIGWDEQISKEMANEWNEFKTTLKGVNEITLPRYIGLGFDDVQYELHGFCDASMKAYAAVVYLRSIKTNGIINVHLIAAKSRVAPTKTISLPRLELCGAVLLGKLMTKIKKALRMDFETVAWTDSMIALAWITGDSHRWETFVANRTTTIQEDIPRDKWRHVGTKDNPADVASRGVDAITLKDCTIWWQGPEWLQKANIETKTTKFETTEGLRKTTSLHTTLDTHYSDTIGRFSSLDKLKRVLAYCIRFANRCRGKGTIGHISVPELRTATTALTRWAQSIDFSSEIESLTKQKQLEKRTGIAPLNPFVDANGIIRVGGRIQSENQSYNWRHPAIMAYSNILTPLIIRDAHLKTLHGGNTLTLAFVREHFWITKVKRAVQLVVRKCVKCTRFKAEMQQQQMGNLPIERTTEARAFRFSGVDFCGPFDVKSASGRGIRTTKGYVAVFICLATKAIHLEVVGDLTSKAFIAALRRMVSRRGHIEKLFSDNGTNFVGANKIIRGEYRAFIQEYQDEITLELTKLNMEWEFIPPSAPNFGGLWEAGVKSVKYHLKRTVGDAKLTYEELSTALCQIEACLNSRPLCAMTDDPNELVLTPAHFLVSEPLFVQPETNYNDTPTNRLQRWQLCQKIQQDFWRKWKDEYLSRLQQRTKWLTAKRNLQKEDIVLVKDERTASSMWPLGRIMDTHEGKDGLVRVVDVRIGKKIFRRPVSKICLLPTRDEDTLIPPGRDAEEKSTSKHGRTATANHAFSTTTILFGLAIMSCVGQTNASFEIQKMHNGPAFYFEKTGQSAIMEGQWNILAFYDLGQYFAEYERIDDGLLQLNQRCTDMGFDCAALNSQFARRIQIIRERNEILTTDHHEPRQKRAILAALIGGAALGGMAYHWLTRTESGAYAESIENLRSNQDHVLGLIHRQTSILEITGNVMKQNFEKLSTEHAELRRGLFQLADGLNRNEAAWKLHDAALQYSLMLDTYADLQSRVLDATMNVNGGRLHPTLVPATQLREQLELILKHLPRGLKLPGSDGDRLIMHMFRTARVKIGFSDKKLIFRITVPLLRATTFWIWRVVPTPGILNNEFIQFRPVNDYLLIDQDNTTYYDLGKEELSTCMSDENEVICEMHHPLYRYGANRGLCEMKFIRNETRRSSDCIMQTLPMEETWIQLDNLRTWIYAMDRLRYYTLTCDSYETPFGLTGTGILTITGNCSLDGETIHLSTNRMESRITTGYMANSRISIDLHETDLEMKNSTIQTNTTDFDQAMQELKRESTIDLLTINGHDTHYYTFIGGALVAVIFGALVYATLKWIRRGQRTTSGPGECTELQTP